MSVSFQEDYRNRVVYAHIDNLANMTDRSIRQGFFQLGRDLKQTANAEILRKPKHGRTYIIRSPSGRKRRHVASAPGETHANITGKLRRSLQWQVHGAKSLEFGFGINNPAPVYGKWIEHGSRRMKPRRSLWNAIEATNRNAERYFKLES